MARLVFMFTSLGNASVPVRFDDKAPSQNGNAAGLKTEGIHCLIKRLLDEKTIEEAFCFVESARGPGLREYGPGHYCRVLPHIDQLPPYLRPDDIIWARGGFKSWPPFLERMNREKMWVLFYRAATNRGSWPYWDVVLDDLIDRPAKVGGRLHLDFSKPVHPRIFHPLKPGEVYQKEYDLLINASHIHDKKGQWRAVNTLIEYKKLYGKNLKAILPGGWYGGTNTRQIPEKIRKHGLDVDCPGMLPRKELAKVYRKSKLYIHLGAAGQNDRGVLEALACGVPVILARPEFHAPFTKKDPRFSLVVPNYEDPAGVAANIHPFLQRCNQALYEATAEYARRENGMDIAFEKMHCLIDLLKSHEPDREWIAEKYGV